MSSGKLDIKIDLSAYNTTLGKLIRSVKDRPRPDDGACGFHAGCG